MRFRVYPSGWGEHLLSRVRGVWVRGRLLSRTLAVPNTLCTLEIVVASVGRSSVPEPCCPECGVGGRTDGWTDDGRTDDGRTDGRRRRTDGRRLGAERELTVRIENYKTFRVTVQAIPNTCCPECGVYGLGVAFCPEHLLSRIRVLIRDRRRVGRSVFGP